MRRVVGALALALIVAACGGSSTPAEESSPGTDADGERTGAPSVPAVLPGSFVIGALQEGLYFLGFDPGPIDGLFGEQTGQAVGAFQASAGIEETGHLDEPTALALADADPAVRMLAVEAMQIELTELGYYSGLIDGDFGPQTQGALSGFQEANGLEQTGTINPETFDLLNTQYAQVADDHVAASGYEQGPPETVPGGEVASGEDLLRPGDQGPEVEALQARLTELGFRPGAVDGRFGGATASAVLAFEKHEGLTRDGIAGPEVLERLQDPQGAGPQSTDGPRIEIDLDRQILLVVDASGAVTTINTSTGSGKTYQQPGGGEAVAYTPTGEFTVERRVDGIREAALGSLYRPLYFEEGWAVHGSARVPAYPASHGCVRTANADQDFIVESIPNGAPVVVYGTSIGDPALAAPGF
jgi:peptidoglycan hydrolase-like protein with peptidoglycan-binding domain